MFSAQDHRILHIFNGKEPSHSAIPYFFLSIHQWFPNISHHCCFLPFFLGALVVVLEVVINPRRWPGHAWNSHWKRGWIGTKRWLVWAQFGLTRPGEHTKSNGKINHFSWENPLFRLGHFPLLFVCSPEGSLLWCCDFHQRPHETGGKSWCWRLSVERICNWNHRRSLRFGSEKRHQWQWRYMRYTWDIHEIYMRCSVGGQLLGDLCQQSFLIRITRLCNGQPVNRLTNPWPSCHRDSSRHVWKASVLF